MANSADDCVPQTLTDFVFDLYDSVTLSQLPEEQGRLYNTVLRELSAKYFATSPWPSTQSIASECNGDPLFLALYREFTHRHWHAVSRPTLRDRMEGWDVYRELFDELLETAEDDCTPSASGPPKVFTIPEWTFDILHEFVYQFQGFCQFRTTLYASASKHNLLGEGEPSGKAPHHVVENLAILKEAGDVWNVETVYSYLHRLMQIGTSSKVPPAYQYFGIFASVALSRLECLLGDYTGCLQATVPILESEQMVELTKPQMMEDEDAAAYQPKSFEQVVHSVVAARISLVYHAGISCLMLRRYKDAITMVGELASYMQRGFKTGELRKQPNSDQFFKNYDRMIAVLAILVQLCPSTNILDENISKVIREKHGSAHVKMTDLLVACLPKFIHPQQPDFSKAGPTENPVKHQMKLLEQSCLEGSNAHKELRSYLKLYTSIPVSKLESFGNDPLSLMSLKLATRQMEMEDKSKPSSATYKSALDIHYFLEDDETVHIDAAEKQRRFENYFLAGTVQSYEIRKNANIINTEV
mmetsp:Transcript_67899/g.196553  ORF Transcript_67899/g.196553 Transcript_67899/m.196553 type:complete len:528 (+) Transcript_67899:132-1715(+)|eukprot:CAMPEP_0176024640 /NCGR_PEP_ID=MMETSP0120_2-20121206/12043_1 /TAXON_ID=160619 /ORGANISM="Kryptoperidinium foliaceum, Strain CCMP 1326" /LENGTH=527 /DNA_ID=CAMNT_0017357819 /DNA_START=107 /DNA_END=1690 /DNA_ORIENTATION=-